MTESEELNPWISILTNPRRTIRTIVDSNPNHRLLILSAIYGFSSLLGIAQNLRLGDNLDNISIIIPALILAPIWGYLLFTLSSWFLLVSGRWLKGEGNYKEIRSALAWSKVPMIATILMWIILLILFKKELFQSSSQEIISSGKLMSLFLVLLIQLTASIWSIVIYVNTLAEVQKFSILKAIANILLVGLLFAIIFIILFALLKWTGAAVFNPSTLASF